MQIKDSILETYQADFGKYHQHLKSSVTQQFFRKLSVSEKTIYAQLAIGERTETNKKALEALELARVINRCFHSAGNGPPLAAENHSSITGNARKQEQPLKLICWRYIRAK